MYTFYHFDFRANRAMNSAIRLASGLGHEEVGTDHLLVPLLCADKLYTASRRRMVEYLISIRGRCKRRVALCPGNFTPELTRAVEQALYCEGGEKQPVVRREALLEKILSGDSAASIMARQLHLALPCISRPQASLGETHPSGTPRGRTLERYGKNLTQLARQNQLDPCIGREKEVQRVLQILCRRQKNNPCLLGEPGVGKTAVVEGLAQMIVQDKVPLPMRYKQIISLDLASMVAGTKYRGDFEERVRAILEEASAGKGIILFIDEVHTIIGAGAAEGAVDAANILKPVLARGALQLIGATTPAEYHRHIEKDAALERRFQQVNVEEPDRLRTMEILRGLRPRYEEFHHVHIEDEALEAAVDYSQRYIADRFLPDKAVDLLDETASGCVIEQKPKSGGVCNITARQIAGTVARWVGIPVEQLTLSERQRLLDLEECLKQKVIGQSRAVHAVSGAVRRFRMGLEDDNRPNGSFLFLGPTGVGKTMLAKILAQQLFGTEKLLFRFDMSEYSEPISVTRLIGAPPGYVGYEQPGLLSEAVHRHPYCIVLFDELEKAHTEVLRLLLQILEEGQLTDNDSRKINFSHTLVMATSNLGDHSAGGCSQLGFGTAIRDGRVPAQVQRFLSPELINRFDEIITFDRLDRKKLVEIARQQLAQLAIRLQKKDVLFEFSEAAVELLVQKCWQPEYGARPLRRGIKTYVEDPLSMQMLQSEAGCGQVTMEAEGNELRLQFRQLSLSS